jgi:mono/diheme cytochrome c family protein
MNKFSTRSASLSTLAICLLMSACGGGGAADTPASNGGGTVPGGTTVPIRSHNAGQNCLSCHRTGGSGAAKGVFTVAGTIYRSDGTAQTNATVNVYLDNPRTLQAALPTDGLGNFFTTQAVSALVPAPGMQFAVGARTEVSTSAGVRSMPGIITNGSCNACHGAAGAGNPGRVVAQAAPAPATLGLIAQVAAGAEHSCAVDVDGVVFCSGANSKGQLGTADNANQTMPSVVTALGSARVSVQDHSIVAGDNHTCALSATQGQVLCWGENKYGQLGNGTTDPASSLSIINIAGVTSLSAAGESTCAQVGTGDQKSTQCWGATYQYDAKQEQFVQSIATAPQSPTADSTAN